MADAIVALEGVRAVDFFAGVAGDPGRDRAARLASLLALGQIGTEHSAAAFKELRDKAFGRPNAPQPRASYTHAERMAETAHMVFWVMTMDGSSVPSRSFNPDLYTGARVSEDYTTGTLDTKALGGWTSLHFRRVGDEWLLDHVGTTVVE